MQAKEKKKSAFCLQNIETIYSYQKMIHIFKTEQQSTFLPRIISTVFVTQHVLLCPIRFRFLLLNIKYLLVVVWVTSHHHEPSICCLVFDYCCICQNICRTLLPTIWAIVTHLRASLLSAVHCKLKRS